MREQKSVLNEQSENWDTGTYQTGPSKPRNSQSIAITVLLMAVIFLGGTASALGVMNVRLLQELMEKENSELYLSVESTHGAEDAEDNFFHSDASIGDQLPEEEVLELRLGIRVQELNTLCRQYWELSAGLQVTSVAYSGSPLQEGDILTSVNSSSLSEISQLYSVVNNAQEGDVLKLGVLRAGQYFTVDIGV